MPKDLNASQVYASQLIDLRYGHPLWYPEPTKYGQVEIGDVGYLDDGCFYRLFNAIRSDTDPINSLGVPDNFVQLRVPVELRHTRQRVVDPGVPLCSKSVEKRKMSASANVPA